MNADVARTQANTRTLRRLLLAVLGMFGFCFAMVPIYSTFCDLTGFNRGEVQALARNTQVDISRQVRVELLANVQDGATWRFTAPAKPINPHPGELVHVDYELENLTDRPVLGRAVPSYGPAAAAPYFKKIECFCFRNQDLAPHEKRVLPVLFVLDSKLPADMGVVTLSYTFFELPKG
jgi:cytochrome c oxidase assembly protein subunit 11